MQAPRPRGLRIEAGGGPLRLSSALNSPPQRERFGKQRAQNAVNFAQGFGEGGGCAPVGGEVAGEQVGGGREADALVEGVPESHLRQHHLPLPAGPRRRVGEGGSSPQGPHQRPATGQCLASELTSGGWRSAAGFTPSSPSVPRMRAPGPPGGPRAGIEDGGGEGAVEDHGPEEAQDHLLVADPLGVPWRRRRQ